MASHSLIIYDGRAFSFSERESSYVCSLIEAEGAACSKMSNRWGDMIADWREQRSWAFGIGCSDLKLDYFLGHRGSPMHRCFCNTLRNVIKTLRKLPHEISRDYARSLINLPVDGRSDAGSEMSVGPLLCLSGFLLALVDQDEDAPAPLEGDYPHIETL